MRGGERGDAALLVQAQHLAVGVGGVLDARRQAGAAVVAAQQAERAHLVDVAADGLRCHVEGLRQCLDGLETLLLDESQDGLLALAEFDWLVHVPRRSRRPLRAVRRPRARDVHK